MREAIEDEILIEIADEIGRLRRTHTPAQRNNLWNNITRKFMKSHKKLPKYLQMILNYEVRENIGYNRGFWKRAGIRFDTLSEQAFDDLRAGVASYCSKHPTFE